MSKFGADTDDFTIGMGRWGLAHITRSGTEGRQAYCRRNPASCKFCHEHGVPQSEPDPFDAACDRLRAHWGKQWLESDRLPGDLREDEIWPADGLHIVALDDETRARTILVSFGDNHAAMGALSAIVAVHNEMIGRPD
jgi:cytochrome c5